MRQWLLVGIALLFAGGIVWVVLARTGSRPGAAVVADPAPDAGSEPVLGSLERRVEAVLTLARTLLTVGTPEAAVEARDLYDRILERYDPDCREARLALGYVDFQQDVLGRLLEPGEDVIPDTASNRRGHAFLHLVEGFHRKRWLKGDEEVERARAAVAAMRAHVARLETDPTYRLGDQMRGNIATDPILAPYNYETRWAPPYLFCYSSGDRLSDHDLLQVADYRTRLRMRERSEAAREAWTSRLDERSALFTQLHHEFLRRYGERHDLRPLTDPHGGRPELGPYRSFPDGVALVVWTFDDRHAFEMHHQSVLRQRVPNCGGYFSRRSSWVWLHDRVGDPGDSPLQIETALRAGVYQLMYWFTRQRNRWRTPPSSRYFFRGGLAGYLSGVAAKEDGTLEFTGWNAGLVADARRDRRYAEARDEAYGLYPLRDLTRLEDGWATQPHTWRWHTRPATSSHPFHQQSWMFIHFLHHHEDGKYRDRFHDLLEAELSRACGMGPWESVFARVFGLRDDEDWDALEAEFHTYVLEELLPEGQD